MNKKSVLFIGAVLFLLATPVAVLADSTEGFDLYSSGYAGNNFAPIVTSSAWTFATDQSTCWSAPTNSPPTGVVALSNTLQPNSTATTSTTNAFEFNFNSNCWQMSTYASITISVNASSSAIFLSWWQAMISVPLKPSGISTANGLPAKTITFSLIVDGTTTYHNDSSSVKLCACWNQILNQAGLPVKAGTTHTITFKMQIVPSVSGAYSFSFAVDTIRFTNNNPIIPNNNFILMDASSGQWFNVSNYKGSQINIAYQQASVPTCTTVTLGLFNLGVGAGPVMNTNNRQIPAIAAQGTSCVLTNIVTPDLVVPSLPYSTVATVILGGSSGYSRSLIPCIDPLHGHSSFNQACNKQIIYLDSSSLVAKYTVTLNDVTGSYAKSGTELFIYLNGELITSGYLDSLASFSTALIPNLQYSMILINAAGTTFSTTINPTATSNSIQIPISGVTWSATNTQGSVGLAGSFSCNSTGVIVAYQDLAALTTKVTLKLFNHGLRGDVLLNSATLNVPTGATSVSQLFTAKQTVNMSYIVEANATRTDGTFPILGPYPVTSTGAGCPNVGPSGLVLPNLPSQVLGLDAILPNGNAWLNIVSLFILFMTAALFGARAASLGSILVVLEAGLLAYLGWLPQSIFYIDMFLIVTIMLFLVQRARRKYG